MYVLYKLLYGNLSGYDILRMSINQLAFACKRSLKEKKNLKNT